MTDAIDALIEQVSGFIDMGAARMLDCFAGDGTMLSNRFHVGVYEGWDSQTIRGGSVVGGGKELPYKYRIADAFKQVAFIAEMGRQYDLILLDPNIMSQEHVGAFDMFPHVWKCLKDKAVLLVTVWTDPVAYLERRNVDLPKAGRDAGSKIMAAREEFYGHHSPPPWQIKAVFKTRAHFAGFKTKFITLAKRNAEVGLIGMGVERGD